MPAKSAKKSPDKSLMIAILGLTGTLITALLASPVLLKLLDKLPTSTPLPAAATSQPTQASDTPQSPGSNLSPVFSTDFEAGKTNTFIFENGKWGILKETDTNSVMEGDASQTPAETVADAIFGPSDFANGVVEFKIRLQKNAKAYFNFRGNDQDTYVLLFNSPANELTLVLNGVNYQWQLQPLSGNSRRPFTFSSGVWYTVRVEMNGKDLSIWMDDNLLMSASDETLKQGYLFFALEPGSIAWFDDLKVWQKTP